MSPDPVCLGGILTFTVRDVVDSGGIKRVDCVAKQAIPPVAPAYTWEIRKPDGSLAATGNGPVAYVTTSLPGTYTCTFTATANRECPPEAIQVGPATTTISYSATLSFDPSSIPAKTGGPVPDYAYSHITVQWNPPECEGMLEIVFTEGDDGYQPPNQGFLDRLGPTLWKYTSFDEPQTQKRPKRVVVWVAAMAGNQELTRAQVVVRTVFTWWVSGHKHGPGAVMHSPTTADYLNAYAFILWKYSPCFPPGGVFSAVSVSNTATVPCQIGVFTTVDAAACTNAANEVTFATSSFTQGENTAASIIGHELDHTVGATECQALTWEFDNVTCTLIGTTYFSQLLADKTAVCGN